MDSFSFFKIVKCASKIGRAKFRGQIFVWAFFSILCVFFSFCVSLAKKLLDISLEPKLVLKYLLKLAVFFPTLHTEVSLKRMFQIFLILSGAGAVFDQRPHVQQTEWQEYISRF